MLLRHGLGMGGQGTQNQDQQVDGKNYYIDIIDKIKKRNRLVRWGGAA